MTYIESADKYSKTLPGFMKNKQPDSIALINNILKCDGREASNSQQAIALAAFSFIDHRKLNTRTKDNRLMIEMPPGTGKSVVIALLVGLVNADNWAVKIKILYNDPALLAFEHDTITNIGEALCQKSQA